jgi:DNA-binding beta-propeller fold protein YncE
MVSTLAGSGTAASSNGVGSQVSFNNPCGVAVSLSGTFAVATERTGHRVRFIDLASLQVTTLAGSGNDTFADGRGTQASFSAPEGVAISLDGSHVIVVEGALTSSHRVRHIVVATGVVTTLAGNGAGFADGVGTLAKFSAPRGVTFSPDGSYILIADQGNYRIRRLDMTTSAVTTLVGSTQGFADGTGTNAKFNGFLQLAFDPSGSYALICDWVNNRIRRLEIATSQVTTLAGSGESGFQDGVGASSIFNWPTGVSIDPTGTYALITDYENQRIRRIVIATAQVTTLAGMGAVSALNGVGAQATFFSPGGISIDAGGMFALVAEFGNNRIRRIALSSPPCSAGFHCPAGSSSPTQVACGAGQFCGVTGLSAPTLCVAGHYCTNGLVFTVRGAVDGQGTIQCVRIWFLLCPVSRNGC